MQARNQIFTILLVIFLSAVLIPEKASSQQLNISYQVFYDQLSPYGQWFNNPSYGYVWVPDAGPDFAPYSTAGHWIMTEYGWTWVSDYDWGWAPFHYGRWDFDDYVGWFWVPDTEWGPSWVVWSRADGYYGWAPMQPGISLNVYFSDNYDRQNQYWMFVRDRDFQRSNLNRYYVDRSENQRIIINSTVINTTYIDNSRHTTYVTGPGRDEVQRNTGKNVRKVTIQEYDKPGQRENSRQLQIYRPRVTESKDYGRRPAPAKVVDMHDAKQSFGRKDRTQPQYAPPTPQKTNQQPDRQNTQEQQQVNPNKQEMQQGKQKLQEQRQKQQIAQPLQEQQKQRMQQEQQKQLLEQQHKQQIDQRNQPPRKDQQERQQPPQQRNQDPGQKNQQPSTVKPQENKASTPAKLNNTPRDKRKKAKEEGNAPPK